MSGLTDFFGIPMKAGDLVLNIDTRRILEFVGPLADGDTDPFAKDCSVRTLGEHIKSRREESCTLINFNAQREDCKMTSLDRLSFNDTRGIKRGDYVICHKGVDEFVIRKVKSLTHSERVICDDGNLYSFFYKFTKQYRWNVDNYPENYV